MSHHVPLSCGPPLIKRRAGLKSIVAKLHPQWIRSMLQCMWSSLEKAPAKSTVLASYFSNEPEELPPCVRHVAHGTPTDSPVRRMTTVRRSAGQRAKRHRRYQDPSIFPGMKSWGFSQSQSHALARKISMGKCSLCLYRPLVYIHKRKRRKIYIYLSIWRTLPWWRTIKIPFKWRV